MLWCPAAAGPEACRGRRSPPLVLSAERESISSACLAMQGLSDSYVFYGHVDQLLLGEELSRRGILETLQYFSQDQELGMGTQVWIVGAVRRRRPSPPSRSGGWRAACPPSKRTVKWGWRG